MNHADPQRFRRTIAVIDAISEVGGYIGGLCTLAIPIILAAEIFSRNLLSHSLHFSWHLAGYLMGAAFLLTCASAMRAGSHVRVTAFLETLSPRARSVVEFMSALAGLVICIWLTWALAEAAWLSAKRGTTAATTFRVPLAYLQAILAIGAGMMTLQCVAQILRLLRGELISVSAGLE